MTCGREHLLGRNESGAPKSCLGYRWRFWSQPCFGECREGTYTEREGMGEMSYQTGLFLLKVVENPVQIGKSKKESYWLMSLKICSVYLALCMDQSSNDSSGLFFLTSLTHALPSWWLGEVADSNPVEGKVVFLPATIPLCFRI